VQADEDVRETAEAVAIAPPALQVQVGERLSFHGRWFGIPVGHGWIEVKSQTKLNGRPVYLIEAEGHSNDFLSTFYPIHDVLRSYVEVDTLRPVQFEKYQREGTYRADEIVTFDYDRLTATYRSLLNGSVKEIPIPPDVQDIISAFYWLRLQSVDAARAIPMQIYSDEKVYHADIQPLRTVTLELRRRGTFSCLVIEPVSRLRGILVKRGRMWVYVTADARRLPVFVKIATPWGPITGVLDRESF